MIDDLGIVEAIAHSTKNHAIASLETHKDQTYKDSNNMMSQKLVFDANEQVILQADLELADLELADLELADLELADLELADLELADLELEKDVVNSQAQDSQTQDSQTQDSQTQDSQTQDSQTQDFQTQDFQTQNFLNFVNLNITTPLSNNLSGEPNREALKLLLIGSPKTVNSTIYLFKKLGYADVNDWSPLQPTSNPGEVMSILIRYIMVQ